MNSRSHRCFAAVVCALCTIVSARADKNNVFYLNLSRYHGNSVVYWERGVREMDKGNWGGAKEAFDAAIQADGQLWPAYLTRAQVLLQLGKYEQALQDCNTAGRMKPQFTRTFITRAQIYGALNRCAEGVADLDRVIAIHSTPESMALALNNRAWLRASCRNSAVYDPKKALEDATKACNLDGWHMANYMKTLALACAVNGDFDAAVRYEKRAIDSGRFEPGELKRAQSHLAAYEKHQVP